MGKGLPSPGDQGNTTTTDSDAPWARLISAAARSRAPEAADLWDRALAQLPADHPDRWLVHARRARTAWACGDHETTLEHGRLALEGSDRSDIATHARASISLATLAMQGSSRASDAVDLDQILTDHAAGTTTPEDDVALAIALADQAITDVVAGRVPLGARTATAVLRLIGPDQSVSRAAIPADMALAVAALYDGRIADARTIADRVMAQIDEGGGSDWVAAYVPWAIDGLIWTAAGEGKQAVRTVTAGRSRGRAAELPVVEAMLDPVEALAHLSSGRWDDAVAVVDDHLARSDSAGSELYRPWLLAVKAIVFARRDNPSAAQEALGQVGDQRPGLHGGGHLVRWAEATIARAGGRHDDAREILRSLDAEVTASGSKVGWAPIALDLIHQEFEAGAAARARCRALISRLAPGSGASLTIESIWHGAHCLAAGDLGGLSDAANALTSPFPFESARFYAASMVVAHWHGRTESAVQYAQRAHQAFDHLGAIAEQRRLAELLAERDLKLPEPKQTPIGLEGLTDEERRIAALVCEGHSNAEVAATVGIAIPKVEAMLHDIYAKAGVNDRLRLAALVAAHSPPWARSRDI